MEPGWAAAVSAVAGGFSAITAITAVFIALRSERRSHLIIKAQIFLTLRQEFLEIYRELGDLEGPGSADAALDLARQAYWHHAYNEWYLSKMAPNELGGLWENFFRRAVESGYAHPPLKEALEKMLANKSAGFGAYAQDFAADLFQRMRTSNPSTIRAHDARDLPR